MRQIASFMRWFCLLGAVSGMCGCMDVATTGAQVIYNRQSLQKSWSDQYITLQAHKAIHIDNKQLTNANIAIATFNGEVLLAGQTPLASQKKLAGDIVKSIPDVKNVYNLLTVSSPSSPLTRISDTWITAKVKTKLLASADLDAKLIKVVTENSTVYLMGILKPEEADAAVDIASTTDGVIKVIKIFSYVKIYKLTDENISYT